MSPTWSWARVETEVPPKRPETPTPYLAAQGNVMGWTDFKQADSDLLERVFQGKHVDQFHVDLWGMVVTLNTEDVDRMSFSVHTGMKSPDRANISGILYRKSYMQTTRRVEFWDYASFTFKAYSPDQSQLIMEAAEYGRTRTAVFTEHDAIYDITLEGHPVQCRRSGGVKRPISMPPVVEAESTFQPKIFSDAEYDRLEQSLPEVFVDTLTCGITNKIMKKPVVAADGYTYEKEAILKWMMQSSLSPRTERVLSSCTLRPNRALADQIECMMTNQDADQDADQDTTKLSLAERLLLAKKESEELDAATASLAKKHSDMDRDEAKKAKKSRAASAPAPTSKGKGKAKATVRASVQPRAKKPRFAPITYKDDEYDDCDGSDSSTS